MSSRFEPVSRVGLRAASVAAGLFVCLSPASAAVTLLDTYWGGKDYLSYGDSIGGGVFNVESAVVSRVGGALQVVVNTAYAGQAGTLGTGYGALFLTPGAHAWAPTGAGPHYSTDVYRPGEWAYAFTMPGHPGGTSGAGGLYAVRESGVVMSNAYGNPVSYPQPGNGGYIFREGQAVQYDAAGQTALAGGSWNVDALAHTITFSIADGNRLGNSFALSWAMDCGNDVLQGQVTSAVPEPSTWAMMIAGVAGLAGVGLRKRRALAARAVA